MAFRDPVTKKFAKAGEQVDLPEPVRGECQRFLKIDDVVTLDREHDKFWIVQNEDDLQKLRERDRAAGRFQDDGGEPLLYGPYSVCLPPGVKKFNVKVTSWKPPWLGYSKRPAWLVQGYCEKLDRHVLFQDIGPRTPTKHRFAETFCSACGGSFGPGDSGYSHCENHAGLKNFDE